MSELTWHVGQTVILRQLRRGAGDREATISRIGRKYVYIKTPWGEDAFHAASGYQKTELSSQYRILTAELDKAEGERREAVEALRGHGVELRSGRAQAINTATLQAMVRLLTPTPDPHPTEPEEASDE